MFISPLFRLIFATLLIVFFTVSCVTVNSHQTGRTLGKGDKSVSGSVCTGSSANNGFIDFDHPNKQYFFADAKFMLGYREKLDVGGSINLATFITGHAKYQFLGTKESIFASSVGFDLGCTPLSLLHALNLAYTTAFRLNNSIHFLKKGAISFTPSYIFKGHSQFSEGYSGKFHESDDLFGIALGLFYGDKNRFSIEISNIASIDKAFSDFQPTMSLGYTRVLK